MVDIFEEALGHISGGLVLDLATGEGGFVDLLAQNLMDYGNIFGVDSDGPAVEAANGNLQQGEIGFIQMEGERLGFAAACFDTVTISASLHHLTAIPPVLAEVARVLKPGGCFVLAEMHRDGQTEAQRTVITMHHWIADVASVLGMVHNRTLARQDLVDCARSLGLHSMTCYDDGYPESDPMEMESIQELEDAIDRTLLQAEEASNYESLRRRGEAMRKRLHEVGAQWEPVVVIVGQKG